MKELLLIIGIVVTALTDVNADDSEITVTLTDPVAHRIFRHIEYAGTGLSRPSFPKINHFGDITCKGDLGQKDKNQYSCFYRISTNNFKRFYDSRRKVWRRQIYGKVAQNSFLELFVENFGIDLDLKKDLYGACKKFSNCVKQYSIPEGSLNCRESKTSFGPGFSQIFYTCALDEKFVEISKP